MSNENVVYDGEYWLNARACKVLQTHLTKWTFTTSTDANKICWDINSCISKFVLFCWPKAYVPINIAVVFWYPMIQEVGNDIHYLNTRHEMNVST